MTFVQARNYTRTGGRQIDLIVIHDMEAPEGPLTAENVAAWFAGPTAPRASAHWCFDSDSAVQCVRDQDVAWHAPGANHNGLGYEHAGYARQPRDEWLDDYSRACLEISAAQARVDCAAYGIPVVFVDAAGLVRGERGITTHAEVSEAFHRSTHYDPGPGFPMDHYLALVAGLDPAPPPPPEDDDVRNTLLIHDARDGAIYVTDLMTKRHLTQQVDVDHIAATISRLGGDASYHEWDGRDIDLLPVIGATDVDEADLAQRLLAVLTPEAIASAIPESLAADVASELAARLAD